MSSLTKLILNSRFKDNKIISMKLSERAPREEFYQMSSNVWNPLKRWVLVTVFKKPVHCKVNKGGYLSVVGKS